MELFEEKKKKVEAEQQSSCVCTACLLESPAFGNGILSSVFAMKSREENEEFGVPRQPTQNALHFWSHLASSLLLKRSLRSQNCKLLIFLPNLLYKSQGPGQGTVI